MSVFLRSLYEWFNRYEQRYFATNRTYLLERQENMAGRVLVEETQFAGLTNSCPLNRERPPEDADSAFQLYFTYRFVKLEVEPIRDLTRRGCRPRARAIGGGSITPHLVIIM